MAYRYVRKRRAKERLALVSFAIWDRSVLSVALDRPTLLRNEQMYRQSRGAKGGQASMKRVLCL
jgi:hypothetical protein